MGRRAGADRAECRERDLREQVPSALPRVLRTSAVGQEPERDEAQRTFCVALSRSVSA